MAQTKRSKLIALRKRKKMTQAEFWGAVGHSQSAGSRWETGDPMPKSTMILLKEKFGYRGG